MKFLYEVDEELGELLQESVKEGEYTIQNVGGEDVYVFVSEQQPNSSRIKETQAIYQSTMQPIFPWMIQSQPKYYSQDLYLDVENYSIYKDDFQIPLSGVECLIVEILMKNPRQVYTREILCNCIEIYGVHSIQDNTLSVHMSRLRKKLNVGSDKEKSFSYIQTIRGVGYKWRYHVEIR